MMLRTLSIFLLMVSVQSQVTDDYIARLTQMYGPTKTVATNEARQNPQSRNPVVPPIQARTEDNEDSRCIMSNGQFGECVPYHKCKVYNVNNQNYNIGGLDCLHCEAQADLTCASLYDTCCQLSDIIPSDQPVKLPQPQRAGCGWANPDGVGAQIGGDSNKYTKFAEFPWMVAILNVKPVNDDEPTGLKLLVYIGGGSLIHPSVVLTVAHYVVGNKTLKIRAGEWDTQTTKEIYPYQDRDAASIEIHKDFHAKNLFYNIAVLFLNKPLDLAPNVGVVCLPPPRIPQRANIRCIATGWGKDLFNHDGRYQVTLKKIELPVVAHDDCQAALRKTRLGKHFVLHSSFMCAGGELGKDTCTGDGGAPLSCPIEYEKDRYVQSGIVAWGIGCGADGTPGVYVDVSVVRDWIDDKVIGKGYDPSTYSF
ncbi:hypothetical protein PYW07_010592 [Mythimna separata]|uniref:Phenoloxidase-activating factor 2 n=1 Tax=Mythimna separata TaxID=271217 RepID=A0AAD7YAW3_MYTSE|nr:hypothetical protein PYW07_010592 [Mythimna separata]